MNRTAPQATQRMPQSIYWKTSLENVLSHEMVQSVAIGLFPVGLRQVYGNKPVTIDVLRTNIERKIAAVSADLYLKIVKNWVQRLDFCKRARGGHAKEIDFYL